jgi:hypothetical protein
MAAAAESMTPEEMPPPEYQFGGGDYAFMTRLPVSFTPGRPEQPEDA